MKLKIIDGWRKELILSATFFLLILVFTSSCKKKDNLLGGNIVDQNELLASGGVDTFQLVTYTEEAESLITSNPRYALLGNYLDPEFGSVKTSFYTQVRLQGLNPVFDATAVVDSVVLALEYAGSYGPVSTQTFEVYRVNEQMYLDSTYYQNDNLSYLPTNLVETGYGTLQIDPSKLTIVGQDTLGKSQLRVRLKNSVGQNIIADRQSGSYDAEFGDDDLFANNYFKGLHVKTNGATNASGSVGYFNIYDQDSKVIIYFTDASGPKTFDLRINDNCASFNHVEANNTGMFVQTVIDNPINGQVEFFTQSHRSKAIIDVPWIDNLPKNIVVHSAILYLPVQHNSGSGYTPPNSLVVANKSKGTELGTVSYVAISGEYAINLRNYIQEYLVGFYNDFTLELYPSSNEFSVDRVVFNGPLTTNKKKPRLVISYTEF